MADEFSKMIGGFRDGNLQDLLESRFIGDHRGRNGSVQMNSSLIQRLRQEKVLEGHQGCVNAISWNSKGSLLISGSDDTRVNVWSYPRLKVLHSIETGHSANIFCTKFIPETSDELVASGAGDTEVRIFNLSRLSGIDGNSVTPSALFQCHTRRVKKLAVEHGNPNVIWSASEDGTLRQHDLREGHLCPPSGSSQQECRNVLLDLRSGFKRSLTDPPKGVLLLKSCDISSTKPHLILVGGSDAFARLYDRRMLPPLTSCRTRNAPPPCVNYYCPMHLSERGRSSLHLTHVTFNPNGEEVLLSYSGEHVHLFDIDPVKESEMKYGPGDASKLMKFTSMPYDLARRPTPKKHPCILSDALIEKCNKLLEYAESLLVEGTTTNYRQGIEACNDVLYRYGHDIDPSLRYKGLCRRASLFLKRKWKNDVHMAVRDSQNARKIDSSSVVPLVLISEALSQLEKHKEALEFALAARCLAPSDSKIKVWLQKLRNDISAAEAEKKSKANNGSPRSDTRRARVLSLADILYPSEPNRDAPHDVQQLEREESDYVEGMEVNFEASTSGDEWRDAESNALLGRRVSVLILQRGDSARESSPTNGSNGSTSSPQADIISYMPEVAIDMKQSYVGHCNMGTDIKQANFLGQRGEYIASGSDDGRWFIWEKRTGRLVKMLLGDEAVVNCVQCHPFDCVVATSGIDHTIKIWAPTDPEPDKHCICVDDPIDSNQRRLTSNREITLPFEVVQSRMHELAEGNLQPFECTQS